MEDSWRVVGPQYTLEGWNVWVLMTAKDGSRSNKKVTLLQRVEAGKQAKCTQWTSWDRLDATAVTA